jgi:hypothetical protein
MKKKQICLFFKNDTAPIRIKIGNIRLSSKNEINALGVTFDSKLNVVKPCI